MYNCRKRILSPFTVGVKNKKLGITLEKNIFRKKKRQNLTETDRRSYYDQDEWLEEFLDNKGAFYDGSASDDSDNDDDNYYENNEQ